MVGAARFVRIWRTSLDLGRLEEYELFVAERSTPMFASQEGCLGVLFARRADEAAVLSFWASEESIDALDRSPLYRRTVAAIEASGMLRGRSDVEVYELQSGAWPDVDAPGPPAPKTAPT